MDSKDTKQYSLVRFWRYIFTPLLLILICFVWYIVFNVSNTQLGVGGLSLYKNTVAIPPASTGPMILK
jgi:hypothetical protein